MELSNEPIYWPKRIMEEHIYHQNGTEPSVQLTLEGVFSLIHLKEQCVTNGQNTQYTENN